MINPRQTADKNREKLAGLGFEVPTHLPTLETMEELSPQSALSVSKRSVILVHLVMLGNEHPMDTVQSALEKYSLTDCLTERESRFFQRTFSEQDRIDCTWLTECLQAIAWCLQNARLDFEHHCDNDLNTKFPEPFTDPSHYLQTSQLRSFEEIYAMADLHYRYHWLSRHGEELLLSGSAIRERRRALDWVIGTEEDWDHVSLDT